MTLNVALSLTGQYWTPKAVSAELVPARLRDVKFRDRRVALPEVQDFEEDDGDLEFWRVMRTSALANRVFR